MSTHLDWVVFYGVLTLCMETTIVIGRGEICLWDATYYGSSKKYLDDIKKESCL